MPRRYIGRREMEAEGAGSSNWVITYTDLCILLFSFFVLLVSMSTVDRNRRQTAIHSVDRAIGFMEKEAAFVGTDTGGQPQGAAGTGGMEDRTADAEMLKALAIQHHLDQDVHVSSESGKTVIRIDQRALFPPGEWRLTPQLRSYLTLLAEHLKQGSDAIEIRGHTDPTEEIGNPDWARRSWELSTRRAMGVFSFLKNEGVAVSRMSARGFSYYQPLVDSFESPQLRDRNRRVELLLLPDGSIPDSLTAGTPRPSRYFNYKKFFFRLFPLHSGPDAASELPQTGGGSAEGAP